MNAVSQQLIPKIYAAGRGSENPEVWAALILAGIAENDSSNAALQGALAKVQRTAASSENPQVWIAALLVDLLTGGGLEDDVTALLALKADINSPTFTGTPAAPTAAYGTNTTQIATTAFVQAAVPSGTVDVESVGLKGDYRALTGLSITIGTPNLTAAAAAFTAADVGKKVIVHGAGTGTDGNLGDELVATISTFVSTTAVTLAVNATVTVAAREGGVGTDNTPLLQAVLTSGLKFRFSSTGNYFFASMVTFSGLSNIVIDGDVGATFSWISANPGSYLEGQTTKPLFYLTGCDRIDFFDFIGQNVGQTIARPNTAQETGYWTVLNGVAVPYDRHFDKRANTGSVVMVHETTNTIVERVTSRKTGALFYNSPGANPHLNRGAIIRDCRVEGFGFPAIAPVDNTTIDNVYFDNEDSPPLDSTDIALVIGTSHAIYPFAGSSNTKIINCEFRFIRTTAIHFNTGDLEPNLGNIVAGNHFHECQRPGDFYGNPTPLQALVANNTYFNCGAWEVSQNDAHITFDGDNAYGEYTPGIEYRGYLKVDLCQTLIMRNCKLSHIAAGGNVAAIQMFQAGGGGGEYLFENNHISSSCHRSFQWLTDHDLFTGRVILRDNIFGAPVYMVNPSSPPASIAGDGLSKFFFIHNTFTNSAVNQFVCRLGVTMIDNIHILGGVGYGMEFDLLPGAGNVDISGAKFVSRGGTNGILLSAAVDNNNTIALVDTTMLGSNATLTLNGNSWRVLGPRTLADGSLTAVLTGSTGLPVSTGITGLGANVATFLATPTIANLNTAVSDADLATLGANTFTADQRINANLGIGGAPVDLLHVSRSAANSTGGILLENINGSGWGGAIDFKLFSSGSGGAYSAGRISVINTGAGGGGNMSFWTPTAGALTTLSQAMAIVNGNVTMALALTVTGLITATGGIASSGDVEASDIGEGFIAKSPDGTRYRLTFANGGAVTTAAA